MENTTIEQQWLEAAKRRRDEVRSGQVEPIPSEEVYQRIDRLLQEPPQPRRNEK